MIHMKILVSITVSLSVGLLSAYAFPFPLMPLGSPSKATLQAPAGTPYWWLDSYALVTGTVSYAQAELADTDGDGAPAWAEFIAGTSPTNQASCFRVSDIAVGGPGSLVLSWLSKSGRLYSVFGHTNLMCSWPTTAVYQTQGDGTWKSYTNSEPASLLFFRLGVELNP